MEHASAAARIRRNVADRPLPPGRQEARPRLADAADAAAPSPALRQQDWVDLQWRAAEAADEAPRWSQRRSLAFIGLTCGTFWACVIAGAAQLLR